MKKKTIILIGFITICIIVAVFAVILAAVPQNLPGPVLGLPRTTQIMDLHNKGLTTLPAEIGEYSDVTQLLLDNNSLTGALPAEIRKMTKLEVISAKNNHLSGIPAEIGQLRNLKTINFSSNNISTYPNELFQLQQSLTLDLSGNPFTSEQINALRTGMPNAIIIF